MHSQKVSFTEQKVDYNIIYHKQEPSGCFFMTLFNAYQVILICCVQNEPLKRSLNFFSGNEYFKHVIDGKVDMKLSDYAREKNKIKAKKFWTPFFFIKLCGSFSGSAVML